MKLVFHSFLRISKEKALLLQINILNSTDSDIWFFDCHLQEVLKLLKENFEFEFHLKSTNLKIEKLLEPKIITGEKVRIAFCFKKRSVRQYCCVPQETINIRNSYKSFEILKDKIIVYVCNAGPSIPFEMSQVLKTNNNSQALISSYFQTTPWYCQKDMKQKEILKKLSMKRKPVFKKKKNSQHCLLSKPSSKSEEKDVLYTNKSLSQKQILKCKNICIGDIEPKIVHGSDDEKLIIKKDSPCKIKMSKSASENKASTLFTSIKCNENQIDLNINDENYRTILKNSSKELYKDLSSSSESEIERSHIQKIKLQQSQVGSILDLSMEDKDENETFHNIVTKNAGLSLKECQSNDLFLELSCISSLSARRIYLEILKVDEISGLSEKQIKYLVIRNEHYFRKIFQGKIYNQRHEDYKKGGLIRVNLNYKVHLTLFTTDQHSWVMDSLMYIFCKKHQEYVDYLLKVLFPEALIKIYMERFKSSHEETELIMIRHVETPHR